mgnify:FL=1
MKILWFKKVGEIADNNSEFKATPDSPWNPTASFAVYQKEEGWTEAMANKHFKLAKCKGEFRATATGQGFIAYMQGKTDNSSELSDELVAMLKA